MSNAYLSQPIVKWLRDRESLSLSGRKYKEAADRIEELESYILGLHTKMYPDSVPCNHDFRGHSTCWNCGSQSDRGTAK